MSSVFDMEVADLGARIQAGFAWWIGELAQMAAPLLRQRGATGQHLVARANAEGGYDLLRDGRPVERTQAARRVEAAILLPADAWLARTTPTPGLSDGECRRLLMGDIDRLTPFEPDDVYVALRFLPGAAGGSQAVLGVAPRRTVDRLVADALRHGVRPTAVIGSFTAGTALDFLPAVRNAGGLRPTGGSARFWWGLVALLLAANVGAAVWRDVDQTRRLEATVAAAQPAADRIRAVRNALQAEDSRIRAIDRRRSGADPLQMLARLTRAVPDGAWVNRLTIEGDAIRLAGERRTGIDVAAALRSNGFLEVRDAAVDLAPTSATPAAGTPFDLVMRAAPGSASGRR